MRGLNRVCIMGNLARTPELRYTEKNSTAYAFLTIAANYSRKNENGEYEDAVDYISCIAWGKNAETIVKHLRKGSQVYVEGRLRQREREQENEKGEKEKRYELQMVLSTFRFLGRKGDSASSAVEEEFPGEEIYLDIGEECEEADIPF